MAVWTVYRYTFPNGKCYVGATSRKLSERQGSGFRRYRSCKKLWDAIQEYGVEAIRQEILFRGESDATRAAELERKYIREYHADEPEHGYNTARGGEGLEKTLTDEQREAKREQMRALARAHIGTHPSDETRSKQSAAKLGVKRGPLSEETRRKIGEANSRANMTEETRLRRSRSKAKMVIAVEKTTGESIIFNDHHAAAEYFGVMDSAVSRWISGARRPRNNYAFADYSPTTTERERG